MGIGKESATLEDFLEKAGGCAVLDGGFATQLERHGATINDPLWSALCLIKDPHLIQKVELLVHSSYIRLLQKNICNPLVTCKFAIN